ncbi:N-acetylmuramoyl-L-alanine amidase [Robertmurraya sp.]|uniref:N-acetylmuramoyl-L-alanine amidase n=1 Tax=Robertmurraya sp. TaxID=2837525 RepID=UPI003703FA49
MDRVKKEDEYEMTKEDANKIIALLGAGWHICKDKASQDEFKRLANEIRKASGQPLQ